MKFYEVKQQSNNLNWRSLSFFRKKQDAETYSAFFNTKTVIYPIKIVEHEFSNIEDLEE